MKRVAPLPLRSNSKVVILFFVAISLFLSSTPRVTVRATKIKKSLKTSQLQIEAPARAGELLVSFRGGVRQQEKEQILNSRGVRVKRRLRGGSAVERVEILSGRTAQEAALELMLDSSVEFAEPNFIVRHAQFGPNDPQFEQQWALRNTGQSGGQFGSDINIMSAWQTTTGAQSVLIAVIDSGIDFTHPDLANNRWRNPLEQANGLDDENNGFVDDLSGWDFLTNSPNAADQQGHGTAIAGIIAAQGDNAIGISGVMWHASLMNLRVLDNTGTGDIADAVEAIDYAVSHGAQVINISWGTSGQSIALKQAIERAGRRGVVVVCSAGNGGQDLDNTPYYPASFNNHELISVAATDNFDQLAPWSNWSRRRVTVAAPGVNILTTQRGGGYWLVTGTSASAPLVSGIVGLIKSERSWLSAAATRDPHWRQASDRVRR